MESISLETLQNFCRTCLKKLKRQKCNINILDLRIRHWLQDATIDNPSANDTYPNSICLTCQHKLNGLLEFRLLYSKSRQKVSEILVNKESVEEIINQSVQKATTDEKEPRGDVPQVEPHFVKIENVYSQAAVKRPIKSDINIEELEIEEEPSTQLSSTLTCVKNEEENIEFGICDFLKSYDDLRSEHDAKSDDEDVFQNEFLKSYDDLRSEHDKSDDEDVCQNGEENSDSQSYSVNEDENSNSDGSSFCEDPESNTKTKKNKSTATQNINKYKYSFRCDKCKLQCVSQQILDIHMRTHRGLKPYQCPRCNISFDKRPEMLKHLNEKHGERELSIICEHANCGKQFKTTFSYKKHYRQKHILNEKSPEKPDKSLIKTPEVHICKECGKTFAKLQSFKDHQYSHGPKELYPFQCTECDKAYVQQRTLKEHQMRHAGIKNFECSYCGARKTTKKELDSHINSHTKLKQYPCPNCPMIFYRPSNLRIHVQVVHQGIRRFACRYCDQTFGRANNLKNHELLHTGEKPHECTECGKRFVQKVSVRYHMKTHHKQK